MAIGSVCQGDLKPGDVLMFRGTDLVSQLIIEFDGGHYSHAALYDGATVVEAVAEGVLRDPLADSISRQDPEYVDIFRFLSDDHVVLGDKKLPYTPVGDRADYYVAQHDRYAYEDLMLLALLTTIRHVPITGPLLRPFIDAGAEAITRVTAEGKTPLICSALVYRCFEEACKQKPNPYHLHISDADLLASIGAPANPPSSSDPVAAASARIDDQRKLGFLRKFTLMTENFSLELTNTHDNAPPAVPQIEPGPDFVTPRDLEFSPNLNLLGRYKK
jgi:hypothetical protein